MEGGSTAGTPAILPTASVPGIQASATLAVRCLQLQVEAKCVVEVGHDVGGGSSDDGAEALDDRLLDYVTGQFPDVNDHRAGAREDILAFATFPKEVWTQIWSRHPPNASTARSAAAPTPSASSPTATPSSGSSAPSWQSRPMNGTKAAATSDLS